MSRREKLWEKFTEHASEEDPQRIEEKLPSMKKGPIKKVWDEVQLLWKLIKDPNAAWGAKAAAIGALIYLISTVDAVPDVIPGVGLLDDVAIILFVCKKLADALKKYAVGVVRETADALKEYTVEVVRETAETQARIEVKKHYKTVWASVLGAIAIAGVVLLLKLI